MASLTSEKGYHTVGWYGAYIVCKSLTDALELIYRLQRGFNAPL